jgi:hypothetical protein
MKKLSILFFVLGIFTSYFCVGFISFNYASMLCGIKHLGFSAPASIVFFYIIPFGIVMLVCFILSFIFYKKYKKG